MSQLVHLATAQDAARLLPLIERFHESQSIDMSVEAREAAMQPLLDGNPLGAIWLIGPRQAPVGYIALSFGWSIARGGMEGRITDFFIREKIRGRGMGGDTLAALLPQLREAGLVALHLDIPAQGEAVARLFKRMGFRLREDMHAMSWGL